MVARDKRRADIAKFIETVKATRVPPGDPNEQAIWIILAHHGTKDGATRACEALWKRYVSVNEFRVAKVTEIADIIEPHVKNDPIVAAEQARGFLRTYFKEHQMVNPEATESRTPDQLRKYLQSLEAHGREIALALALHYCRKETEEAAAEGEKKRAEKDLTASANRLRLLFAFSAYGSVTTRTMATNASRAFAKSWAYKPLPKPEPAQKKVPKKVAKKAPAKKKAAKKAPAKKKVAKKKAPARPKATRKTTRKRTASKKSSRR